MDIRIRFQESSADFRFRFLIFQENSGYSDEKNTKVFERNKRNRKHTLSRAIDDAMMSISNTEDCEPESEIHGTFLEPDPETHVDLESI